MFYIFELAFYSNLSIYVFFEKGKKTFSTISFLKEVIYWVQHRLLFAPFLLFFWNQQTHVGRRWDSLCVRLAQKGQWQRLISCSTCGRGVALQSVTNVTDCSCSGVSSLKPPEAITAGVLKIPIADACQRGTYGLVHVQNDLPGSKYMKLLYIPERNTLMVKRKTGN